MLALLVALLASGADSTPPPPTVLVLPLEARNDASAATADLVTALLADEVRRQGTHRAVTLREVEGAMTHEQRKQVAGCDSVSCAAEIAGAMNTEEIILGSLGNVGPSNVVLSFSRVQARTATVLGSSVRRVESTDPGTILDEIPGMVAELFTGTRPPPRERTARAPAPAAGDERTLALVRRTVVHGDGKNVNISDELFPVQGPYQKELSWPEFYRAAGHPELADSYQRRLALHLTLWLGGAGVAVLGVCSILLLMVPLGIPLAALVFWPHQALANAVPLLALSLGGSAVVLVLALGVAAAGTAAAVAGMFVPVQPASEDEVRRMADEHNRGLAKGSSP